MDPADKLCDIWLSGWMELFVLQDDMGLLDGEMGWDGDPGFWGLVHAMPCHYLESRGRLRLVLHRGEKVKVRIGAWVLGSWGLGRYGSATTAPEIGL